MTMTMTKEMMLDAQVREWWARLDWTTGKLRDRRVQVKWEQEQEQICEESRWKWEQEQAALGWY